MKGRNTSGDSWLTVLFLAFTVAFLLGSRGLSAVAGTTPRVIAVVTLIVLFLHFMLRLQTFLGSRAALRSPDNGSPSEIDIAKRPGQWAALCWHSFLLVTVLVFGLSGGLSLFCLGYMRWRSAESWRFSIFVAVAVGLAVQSLFSGILGLHLYGGLVGSVLG